MSGADTKAGREMEKRLKKDVIDYTKKRDEECIPLAKLLFERLGKRANTLIMGNTTTKEAIEEFYQQVFTEDISDLLVGSNVKVTDVDYIFRMMLQVISFLQDQASKTLALRVDQASAKVWGLKDVDDLRILHVTNTLADLPLKPEFNEPMSYPQASNIDKK